MKNLLLLSLGLVLLAACKKEEQLNTNGFVPGMVLEPEAIMENVPQEYLQDSVFIIFKNADGEEKRIKHVAETFLDTNGIVNGDPYTEKKLSGEFSDPENIEFTASWIATVVYNEDYSLQELLIYSFMFDYAGKIVAGNIAYINREPSHENIWDDSIELLGRTFSGYRQCINEERPGYSEMIFNNQYGLIAFRDREEELWVFDRFE
jgi:hypothetical protein